MCEDTLLLSGEPIVTCISLSAVKGDETKGERGNPKTAAKVRISPFSPHVSPPWTLFSFTPFSLFRTFNCLQAYAFAGLGLLPFLGDDFVRTTRTDVPYCFVLLLLNSFDTVFAFVGCRR